MASKRNAATKQWPTRRLLPWEHMKRMLMTAAMGLCVVTALAPSRWSFMKPPRPSPRTFPTIAGGGARLHRPRCLPPTMAVIAPMTPLKAAGGLTNALRWAGGAVVGGVTGTPIVVRAIKKTKVGRND